jgi:hypothetical protein
MTASSWIKRSLIFVHRWLGVLLCVLFLLWFPSGIVMMYWDFPSVSSEHRLHRSPALDPASIVLSPVQAAAKLEMGDSFDRIRLNTFDGRPVYRFGDGANELLVYADTGDVQLAASTALMDRVASAWTGRPAADAVATSVERADQWTLQIRFADVGPLRKYEFPDGQHVYISHVTGEVVQYTTKGSRLGAYAGSIPHWFYFAPLRVHGPQWARVVIWSSALGTFSAILGIVIGVWMYSPSKRYWHAGNRTSIPYHGHKRLHTILGLAFGLAAVTWAFSGMLSMEPFPASWWGDPEEARRQVMDLTHVLRGRDVRPASFSVRPPAHALSPLAGLGVKELELTSILGEPSYLAVLGDGSTRILSMNGSVRREVDHARLMTAIVNAGRSTGGVDVRLLDRYDRYYLDRRGTRPLPVLLVEARDGHSRHYVDPRTAQVVGSYSSEQWVNRWVYHGLHSLNFPWLYDRRPLWDIVVITFMVGGTALCVTSLILAWRVLGRRLSGVTAGPMDPDIFADTDDLIADGRSR